MPSVAEMIAEGKDTSDLSYSERKGYDSGGLQSGDVSGSLGAGEASYLRAQEQEAAEEGTLDELAHERLGDPTATMQDGVATATSPDTLESDVVDVDQQDVAEAAQDVRESEGGEFADGTTARATGSPHQSQSSQSDAVTVAIEGRDSLQGLKSYRLETTGGITAVDGKVSASEYPTDDGTVTGNMNAVDRDVFMLTGQITSADIPDGVKLLINGQEVNPASIGSPAPSVEMQAAGSSVWLNWQVMALVGIALAYVAFRGGGR